MKTLCFNCAEKIIKNDFVWLKLPSSALVKICPQCASVIDNANKKITKQEVKQ